MAFMKWTKEVSVQVKDIDDQHKKIVEIVNKGYEYLKKKNLEKIQDLLDELIEYARYHFSTEEKYFEEFDYEGKKEHIEEHIIILQEVLEYDKRLKDGEDIAEEFFNFIKEWLEDHLMTMDHKYIKCFKENGLE